MAGYDLANDTIKGHTHEDTRKRPDQDYREATRATFKAAIEGSNGNRSEDAGQPSQAAKPEPKGLTATTVKKQAVGANAARL